MTKKRPLAIARDAVAALLLTLAVACQAAAEEPTPPASYDEIVEYRDSGEWDTDMTEVVDRARASLAARLSAGDVSRPAVVLDIDDTSLSNYECLKRARFRESAREACSRSGELPAIPQTLDLFRYARSQGVAVFFITGRRERVRALTTTNLRESGYRGTYQVIMRPTRQPASRRAGWKARSRRALVRRGYDILINVGDQRSDLTGGYARRTFKLPNPMYVIKSA